MRISTIVPAVALIVFAALALGACGGEVPAPSTSSPTPSPPVASATSAPPAYTSSTGRFAPFPAEKFDQVARSVGDCNVDAVDDRPVSGASVQRGATATFTGWAADSATRTHPDTVQLVLRSTEGRGDFAVEAATGAMRSDVVAARHVPEFATSGWAVQANLSAVPPGRYQAVLVYEVAGQLLSCDPHHDFTVE